MFRRFQFSVVLGVLVFSLFAMFSLAKGEEKKEEVKEKSLGTVRKKLISDKSLLFYVPFDFSVDAKKAYHNKVGTLKGEGEFVEGVVENCLSLPASLGKGTVSYGFVDNIDFKKAGTLMFWFKPYWWGDDTSGNRCLLKITLSNQYYYTLYRSFREEVPTHLWAIITNSGEQTSTRSWKKDKWLHLAFTWDAVKARYIGYVNSKQVFTSVMQWAVLKDETLESHSLGLGGFYNSDLPIDAAYDEFYVLGRALSKEEITDYYNETSPTGEKKSDDIL